MAHAANTEKYSSINRIAIAERASLEDVDRPSPYSAICILFLSREVDDDVRDIGKHDFRSVLLHLMLSKANVRFLPGTLLPSNHQLQMVLVLACFHLAFYFVSGSKHSSS